MPLIKADRVKETTTSTGTGTIALAGAATGYRAFSAVCAVGDTLYYAIAHQTAGEWEVGLATYSAANTLTRTTVHASSNSNLAVTFSAGTKDVFLSVTKAWLDTFVTQTSGTANYVVKSTGTGTIGNSQIFDNGTLVGIGTSTNPSGAKLEIQTADGADSIGMSGYKTMKWESNNHLVYGGYSAGQWQVLKFYTNGVERYRVDAVGNVGIGTTSPSTKLDVAGSITSNSTSGDRLIFKRSSDNATMTQIGTDGSSETYITSITQINLNNSGSGLRLSTYANWADSTAAENIWVKHSNLVFQQNALAPLNRTLLNTSYFQVTAANYNAIPAPTSRLEVYGDTRIESQAAATKVLIVKGASAQSANLQEWQNNSGTVLASIASDGGFSITNSTALIARDSAYTDWTGQLILQGVTDNRKRMVLGIDTTNNLGFLQTYLNSGGTTYPIIVQPSHNGGASTVGIGSVTAPDGQLHVSPHLADRKALVVRAKTSQTANLTEWQNNAGTSYASINSNFGAQFYGWSGEGPHGGVEQVCLSAGLKNYWSSGDAALITIGFVDIAGVYDGTSWSMYFKTGSSGSRSERMRITHTGLVGIGTTSPVGQLHTQATASGTKALVVRGASGQSANLQEWQANAGTALASIDSSGRLTIAASATASNADLYFNNSNTVNPAIKWNAVSGATGLRFYSGSSLIGAFQDNGAVRGNTFTTWGGMNFGDFYLQRGSGGIISFNSSGPAISVGAGTLTTADSTMQVVAPAASKKSLVVSGAASQTGNLQEWQNSSGTALASVDASGNLSVQLINAQAITNFGRLDTYFDSWYGSINRRVYRVTVPSTIGNYQEIFKLNWHSNTIAKIKVYAFGSGIYNAKEYDFNSTYGSEGVLLPSRSAYLYNTISVQYELESKWDPATGYNTIRVKRTAGTDALSLLVYVEVLDATSGHPVAASGTGTSSIGGIIESYSRLNSIAPPDVVGGNGSGYNLNLYGGAGLGTGNGGNILLQAGAYSTSGSNGKVIVRGLASNTANLQEWQNNAGSLLSAVNSAGDFTNTGGYSYTEKFGNAASVSSSYATAIGYGTTAGQLSTAVGAFAVASGVTSTAFGADANAAGSGGTALGRSANAAAGAVAVGISASASGNNGIAVGRLAIAGTGTAIGYNFTGSGVGYTSFCASTDGRFATGAIDVFAGDGISLNTNISRQHSILGTWATATYASRLGRVQLRVNDYTTDREAIRYESDGANALTSIGGAAVIASTTLAVQPAVSGNKGIVVKGASGQSANLQEWQNNAGTALAYIRSNGTAVISPVSASGDSNAGLSVVGVTNDNDSGLTIYPNNLSAPTRIGWSAISFSGTTANINVGSNTNSNALYCRSRVQVGNSTADYSSATLHVSPLSSSATGISVRAGSGSSANLQEWQNSSGTALALVDASGNVRTTGSIQITSNTPAAFTADQNNLVLNASGFQRLSGTAARTITGIAPPSGASHVDGRMMRIYNVGSYNITLKHNSTSSSIANRFCCVQAIDIVLGPRDFAELIYDATDGGLVSGQNNPCWRVA